ncbi:hypothetical protein ACFQNE_02930 [Gordonia phosphorivorans]|uniref:Uncharacterized protein n=1 Tax=Gordonia phosphorivorans TaxID=1056982 RepID=A0ABV6H4W2_9ACTN
MTAPAAFERKTTGGSFVAYEARPSRATVEIKVGDGTEQVFVHPEVFIQEYPSIKVLSVAASERGNGLYVQFDPASVPVGEGKQPLTRAIAASTVAGGEIEAALRRAQETGRPVYLAVERRRKYKSADGKVISYDEPIMALRGFTEDGESTDAAQGVSKANISKVLALVGPADRADINLISSEARSNPLDWPLHRSNRVGKTPAQGWVRITRPDGTPGGAAIPREMWRELSGAATGGTAQLDDAAVSRIADAVAVRMGAANDNPTISRPPQRTSRSAEGKRWDLYNSDGRVNPGSYAVSGLLAIRDTALTALGEACFTEQADADSAGRTPNLLTRDQISTTATAMMGPLSEIVDQVQTAMTGKPANRINGSSATAAKIIRQVVLQDVPLTVAVVNDPQLRAHWLTEVGEVGRVLAAAVLAATESYLDEVSEPTPINDASGRAHRQVDRQNDPVDPRGAASPANSNVQRPPTPNFSVGDNAVSSIRDRNHQALQPLLEAAGMQPEHAAPLLAEQFGTADLDQVDPELLAGRVQTWGQEPARFRDMAQHVYTKAQQRAS